MPLVFLDLHQLILPICHLHHRHPPRRLWRQLMKRHHDKNCQLFDPINQGSVKEVDVCIYSNVSIRRPVLLNDLVCIFPKLLY